jgi:hypothetical protein
MSFFENSNCPVCFQPNCPDNPLGKKIHSLGYPYLKNSTSAKAVKHFGGVGGGSLKSGKISDRIKPVGSPHYPLKMLDGFCPFPYSSPLKREKEKQKKRKLTPLTP